MKFVALAALAAQALLAGAVSIPHGHVKRAAEQNATLYAYGANASAWPVAMGLSDNRLYVAQDPTMNTTILAPLLWNLASITGEDWIANATYTNGSSAGSLYITPDEDHAVGVTALSNIGSSVNGTVSGFALFATQLVYNNNTYLQAQFWARPSNYSGLYGLCWIAEGDTPESGSFPVVLKGSEDST